VAIYSVVHFPVNRNSYKNRKVKMVKHWVFLEHFVLSFKRTVEKEYVVH